MADRTRRAVGGLLALLGLGGVGYRFRDRLSDAGSDAGPSRSAPATPGRTPTPTATATPVTGYAETVTYGGKELTVADPRTARELTFDDRTRTADEGRTHLLLWLSARNVSDEPLNQPWPLAVRHDGTEEAVRGRYNRDAPERIAAPVSGELYGPSTIIYPDVTSQGWAYASVPAGATEATVVWSYSTSMLDAPDDELTYEVPVPNGD